MIQLSAPLASVEYRTALNGDAILCLEMAGFIADINYRGDHKAAQALARSMAVGAVVRVNAVRVDHPQSFGRLLYPLRGAELA